MKLLYNYISLLFSLLFIQYSSLCNVGFSESTVLVQMSEEEVKKNEKPIVVVICSYNNEKWSTNTLDSIFSQHYSNFRVIIVDDCSTDNNQAVIQEYIDSNNLASRVIFIKNDKRKRKLFNLYRVLYTCDDNEIVVMVDGDDSLAHSHVFSQLNKIYDSEQVWFTYGQYKNVPAEQAILYGHHEMGYCRPVPKHIVNKQTYRYYSFIYMHLRSFRGWLFKLVKLEDLIADNIKGFEGDFYPASNDVAMYYPMVEMSHTRIKFISDILYIRNLYSDIVGFKVDKKIQTTSAREIRKKAAYRVLFKPKKNRLALFENAQADVFIVCKSNPEAALELLQDVYDKVRFLHKIHLFFTDSLESKAFCRRLKQVYPDVIFVPYTSTGGKSLKNRLLDSLSAMAVDHVILTMDSCSLHQECDVSQLIYDLEKTYAYNFYMSRDSSQLTARYIDFEDGICAWKFLCSINGWRGINSVDDVILYRKSDLIKDIQLSDLDTTNNLVSVMRLKNKKIPRVGLFFKDSKITFNNR
jgi:glycosyltransferase involved in cell wall biosynthesis